MGVMANNVPTWIRWMDRLDRRVVYLMVMLSLLIPILLNKSLKMAKLKSADMFYNSVERLESRDDQIVLIASDWGPSTKAENEPQTEAVIEHLMKRRIKFGLLTGVPQGMPFLIGLPQKIAQRLHERTGETWTEGEDWVNFGYRPGQYMLVQQLPKAEDLRDVLKVDASNIPLREVPCMQNVSKFSQIPMLVEITGLSGVFAMWLQFFQTETHRPVFVHGCTSITIPEAYIFLDSGQITGLLEGMAGAAYYMERLGYSKTKPHKVMTNMTALSLAHLVIIAFIIVGNIGMFIKQRHNRAGGAGRKRP